MAGGAETPVLISPGFSIRRILSSPLFRPNLLGILVLLELPECELATCISVRSPHSPYLLSTNLLHFFPDGNHGPATWTLTTTGKAPSSPDSAV